MDISYNAFGVAVAYYRNGAWFALDTVAEYRSYRCMGMTASAALAAVRQGMPF